MSGTKLFNSLGDRVFLGVIYLLLSLCLILVLVPLLFILAASFSSPEAISSGRVFLLPVDFNVKGYSIIFKSPYILRSFSNTVLYTAAGTAVNIFMTMLAAYGLSRRGLPGKNGIMFLFVFSMLFSGGMVPTYLVVNSLRMVDTFWAMVLPNAMTVWNMIVARTYIQTNIPYELHECAMLDGCRETGFLVRIVLPLAKPILAVLVLLYAVSHWNSYFNALIYLRSVDKLPLQIVLRDILISGLNIPDGDDAMAAAIQLYWRDLLQYGMIVVASLPIMAVYPFIQKYFVKGLLIGSIKG